ncbi:unnamed protein product [Nesidiocoris tenuis]|uniref:Uncharacterized protein n=1 Tax=Nesidiocoris tenuis TaxID=355587 RepID=A0A6H5HCK1_9HEMI|nr:unnamed protein product [Nesidiocoris tenuis]
MELRRVIGADDIESKNVAEFAKGIKLPENNNNKCTTKVGKTRISRPRTLESVHFLAGKNRIEKTLKCKYIQSTVLERVLKYVSLYHQEVFHSQVLEHKRFQSRFYDCFKSFLSISGRGPLRHRRNFRRALLIEGRPFSLRRKTTVYFDLTRLKAVKI